MPVPLDPIEFYKVHVRFLTTEEGGRSEPIHWTFAAYRPDFTMTGATFHGAVFMDAPGKIAPGDQADVEISFWYCESHHQFNPADTFYLHEGPRRVAKGTVLLKGINCTSDLMHRPQRNRTACIRVNSVHSWPESVTADTSSRPDSGAL